MMGLGDLYRKRYRRQQRRRMLAILFLLMVVAAMLVAMRSCSDHINKDMQNVLNPFDEQADKLLEQKLKEHFKDKMKQLDQMRQ